MNLDPRNMETLFACTLAAAAAWGAAFDAVAGSHFSAGTLKTLQVFCDMPNIKGDFSATKSRYVSNGTCVELQGDRHFADDETPKGTSQFDDYSKGKDVFRAEWTAEGGYDPATRETWETIILPPPRVDEKTPPGRPYGQFASKMICSTDPWLDGNAAHCVVTSVTATGNLGDAEQMLRQYTRPFTVPRKPAQTQALYDAHELFFKRRAQIFSQAAPQSPTAPKLYTLPEIMEPRAGSTYPPQTPLKIRVKPPSYVKVQTYLLQIEAKQKNGEWQVQTNVPVSAAELEGVLGYKGWGWHQPGTGLQMTATVGTYRVRAQASYPDRGEAGAWHEFDIAGEPGPAPDRLQTGKVITRVGLGNAPAGTGVAPAAPGSMLAKSRAPVVKEGSLPTPQVLPQQKATLDWSKSSTGASTSQLLQRSQP